MTEINPKYLDTMRSLWSQTDPKDLEHRVGFHQFAEPIVEWYRSMIFPASWNLDPENEYFDGLRVLEYGCGVGRLLVPSATKYPKSEWFGVDISPTMIKDSVRRGRSLKNLHTWVTPGDGIPEGIPGVPIRVAYSVITFQHICSRNVVRSILKSIFKSLQFGGRFVLQVKRWSPGLRPWDYEPGPDALPGRVDLPKLPPQFHHEEGNAYTPEQLEAVLKEAGFCIERLALSQPIDDHGQWLWAYADKLKEAL